MLKIIINLFDLLQIFKVLNVIKYDCRYRINSRCLERNLCASGLTSGAANNHLRIRPRTGMVGILQAPEGAADVFGWNATQFYPVSNNSYSLGGPTVAFANSYTNYISSGTSATLTINAASNQLRFGVGGTNYANMNTSGYLYIGDGTTSATYPLYVNSTASVSRTSATYGYLNTAGAGSNTAAMTSADCSAFFTGRIVCTSEINAYSDRRAKKNIETLDEDTALNSVKALRAVSYQWDDGREDEDVKLGWIAQEVGEAGIGEALTLVAGKIRNEDGEIVETDDFHMLDKEMLSSVNWAATRKLIELVESLQSEVTELKAQLEKLQN